MKYQSILELARVCSVNPIGPMAGRELSGNGLLRFYILLICYINFRPMLFWFLCLYLKLFIGCKTRYRLHLRLWHLLGTLYFSYSNICANIFSYSLNAGSLFFDDKIFSKFFLFDLHYINLNLENSFALGHTPFSRDWKSIIVFRLKVALWTWRLRNQSPYFKWLLLKIIIQLLLWWISNWST